MSEEVKIQLSKDKPQVLVQSLPCKIHYNGNAKVKEYFETTIEKKDGELTANLRGRPLRGVEINLPEGINGYILNDNWKTIKNFKTIQNWVLDKDPKDELVMNGILNWMELSDVIHKPIEIIEQVEKNEEKK